jgi:uncharacterized membrane protein
MKKILLTILLITGFIFPSLTLAQDSMGDEEIFKAKVIEILDEEIKERENGTEAVRQKLKLEGLDGSLKDKEFIFEEGEFDILSTVRYNVGDKVIVNKSFNFEGQEVFYITDRVRSNSLIWLGLLFALAVIAIGRFKGLRALVVLFLTFLIILKFIIPQILLGNNPILISIIGSLFILIIAIYITEGFKTVSHVSIFAILISLLITGALSVLFTELAKISGFVSEDIMFLMSSSFGAVDLKGLLLAGIIIGSLGVLDDVVIAQVITVEQLKKVNPNLSRKDAYKKAMKVGVSHLSSMINTLFLAYAGVSLPLLLLFNINEPPFLGFSQIINNEMVAIEIVRALTGSIGLVLAIPIATILAVNFIKKKELK